ncbi:hypothetical protein AALT52_01535 [Ligilactobacillus faecis]|uniref:Uncharacterized protein n=1 Tax=Ligilactobacillus faecis TaxID=762833 RepID=A0ABV4DM73_9LACO
MNNFEQLANIVIDPIKVAVETVIKVLSNIKYPILDQSKAIRYLPQQKEFNNSQEERDNIKEDYIKIGKDIDKYYK